MASWIERGHAPARRVGDRLLVRRPGASQAGILLGSNEDIPAFRWVEKETGRLMTCSAPADCAEIERRRATGIGLLVDGGASRGNLLSGEADHLILTVSRIEAEKGANPGYRAFLANGFNVTRVLVLLTWEVILEWVAATRGARRNVRPRGHRGGIYPLLRAVDVRLRPRPDRVRRDLGHDERPARRVRDVLELRRGRAPLGPRARGHARGAAQARRAVRPHRARARATRRGRTRSSCSRITARRRARRSSSGTATGSPSSSSASLDARQRVRVRRRRRAERRWSATRSARRRATRRRSGAKNDVSDRQVVVLGSGNLGLVYLMEEQRRLSLEEIERAPPAADPDAARASARRLPARPVETRTAPLVLGRSGVRYLADDRVEGDDPLAHFSPNAADHLRRTDGFEHVADIMVNSFYDPQLDEGCAFEELISFHGGMGGPQTAAVHPPSGRAAVPGGADRRRRGRARAAHRLAPALPGRATPARRGATGQEMRGCR